MLGEVVTERLKARRQIGDVVEDFRDDVLPAAALAAQSHLPGAFMKFIGIAETLGALGLILPGIFHVRESLTSLAATGLVIIMAGAVVTTLVQHQPGAVVPAIVGILAAYVAWGRRTARA